NAFAAAMLRAGLPMGPMILLTVRGRKSGQLRTQPLALLEHDGQRLLIGSFGPVNWVQNLRVAGEGILTRRGGSEQVKVVELPPAEAAPILKWALGTAAGAFFTRGHYEVSADSSLAEIEHEAPHHPVFRIIGLEEGVR